MREVYSTVLQGFKLLSLRGKLTVALSSFSLVLLSAVDAAALYLLTRSLLLTTGSDTSGIVVDTSLVDITIVVMLFVVRSLLAIVIGWVSINQLSYEQTRLGVRKYKQLVDVKTSVGTTQETKFYDAVHRGPEFLVMTLANAGSFLGEVISMVVLLGFFLIIDSITAILAVGYFTAIIMLQHRWLAVRSTRQGELIVQTRNEVYQLLGDTSKLRAEFTHASVDSATSKLQRALAQLSRSTALSFFLSYIPRQLLELTFIIGLGVVSGLIFFFLGPLKVFAALILFAGISFRLMPTVNRVQGLALTMLAHTPIAKTALAESSSKQLAKDYVCDCNDEAIRLEGIHFEHAGELPIQILADINLTIKHGYQYALVGPSGSGKTTLAKIILGHESPSRGLIYRSLGLHISFVPQDTHLAYIPLAENVSMTWDRNLIDFDRVAMSLKLSGLDSFLDEIFNNNPMRNDSVSGGEKQRIGLARAFYSGANFIILDEVTNSLDADTENQIVNTLYELRGKITTLIISHRLTTIRRTDHVFYLHEGSLLGSDTFQNLRSNLREFQRMIEFGRLV